MPSTCEFQLNNPNAVYHSGETVSGTIVLKTTTIKDVRDIRIIFQGEGKVSWNETESRRKSDGSHTNHTVHYKSNELYISNTTTVHGGGSLPAGTHTYTFQILLPLACPTSCEGRYGQIRYELMLCLDRPHRFNNEFSKPLTVIKLLDLNSNPALRIPIESEDVFSSCCWSCSSGKVTTTLTIPFGGYTIGQNLKYSLNVQNQSMDDIDGYTVTFMRKMIFTALSPQHKTRDDTTILYKKLYTNRCLRLTTRIFDGNFPIVPTPPTTEGESIIRVCYFLNVELNMGGCCLNNSISVPICIGTVPLRESIVMLAASENHHLISMAPTAPELPFKDEGDGDLPPSYREMVPPSFEEATRSSSPFLDADKSEYTRHIGFRPLYPSYSQNKE